MVPRRAPEPRVEPVALPLPAAGVPVRATSRPRTGGAASSTPSTSCSTPALRRRPLLDRRGRLREGRPARPADDDPRDERGARHRHDPRAADRVVPQHLGLGRRTPTSRELRSAARLAVVTEHPFLGRLELVAEGRRRPCSSATTRRTPSACSAARRTSATPKDGINDHVIARRRTVAAAAGTKAAFWYRLDVAPGRPRPCGVRLRPADRGGDPWADFDAVARERLEEADEFYAELTPADGDRRRGARAPPVARRDALEQAALRLRRRALARRRPDAADAAGVAARRPQRALAHVRRLRHHVDARQVGVPVVRRLGLSPSTASRSPASTPRSRSTS